MNIRDIEVKHQIIDATFDLLRLIAQSKSGNSPADDVEDVLRRSWKCLKSGLTFWLTVCLTMKYGLSIGL